MSGSAGIFLGFFGIIPECESLGFNRIITLPICFLMACWLTVINCNSKLSLIALVLIFRVNSFVQIRLKIHFNLQEYLDVLLLSEINTSVIILLRY